MFAGFALLPRPGGVVASQPPPADQAAPMPPPSPPAPPHSEREVWADAVYQQLAASPLVRTDLEAAQPTAPVILHPSVPRGADPPPITARHLGFLRVDLTGDSAGPGRFFPLFPEDAAEEQAGVDTGSLDRFGCTGHWASSGCVRLLAASCAGGGLALVPPAAFAALWERCEGEAPGRGGSSQGAAPGGWHVPYRRLLPLEEAYGGLCRELTAAGRDLSRCHYMLRGWKTRDGRPRLGASAPRAGAGGGGGATVRRPRRGVVPAELSATRELRALANWPGLLELLEGEGVESMPTDGVRYWLARLGAGFQARLAAAGVLCGETSVHHIIARSARGVDHPLNYFLIDRAHNSAMGSRVEGFRDSNGVKLHMRDIVGERVFEVAQAACNLYHGVLWAGRRGGAPPSQTLRELREGAFALAEEAVEERRAQEARRQARGAAAGPAAIAAAGSSPEGEAAQAEGRRARAPKRERFPEGPPGSQENAPLNTAPPSPTQQQQQERRRCLSGEVEAAAVAVAEQGTATVEDGLEVGEPCGSPEGMHVDGEGGGLQRAPQGARPPAGLDCLRERLRSALGVT